MRRRWAQALLALTVAKAVGALGYVAVVRPWLRHWGTTSSERTATLPGDELVLRPRVQSTRAVPIRAGVDDVWPWLVQMGQDKGGLYSYDWLENLFGLDIHSVVHVVPEWQHLAEGDLVRLAPEGSTPDLAFEVVGLQPGRALVLGPRAGDDPAAVLASGLPYASWAFVLEAGEPGDGEDGCRLVVRFRSDFAPTVRGVLANQVVLEPVQFVMERKMMLGIKQRAEARARDRPARAARGAAHADRIVTD